MNRAASQGPQNSDAVILVGAAAYVLGVGVQRFADTPLIPALIAYGWLTPPEAAYVGATNLFGYLLGALIAPAWTRRVHPRFCCPACDVVHLHKLSCSRLSDIAVLVPLMAFCLGRKPWRVIAAGFPLVGIACELILTPVRQLSAEACP